MEMLGLKSFLTLLSKRLVSALPWIGHAIFLGEEQGQFF